MTNRTRVLFVAGVALILGASAVWQFRGRAIEPPPSLSQSSAVSEPATTVSNNAPASLGVTAVSVSQATPPSAQTSFAVVQGDNIASWNFKGAYTDNPELVAEAQSEISRLSGLLTTATSSAMILSVGIANQYELIGDGKKQYEYLGHAIQANRENGLPWHNLGVLMERLGALQTARVAYEKATFAQPQLAMYHYAYIEFLIQNMKDDTARIEKAFAWAEKVIGQTQYLTELRTKWKTQ